MALSNYEKQKRWRAKNRALYNLQQRNRRKKGGDATCQQSQSTHITGSVTSEAAPTVQSSGAAFQTKKVGEFRMLVIPEENAEERSTMPAMKPKVFFNDHGAQISEKVWNELQEKKRIAREVGYEFDPQ